MRAEDKKLAEELLARDEPSDSVAKRLFFGDLVPFSFEASDETTERLVDRVRTFADENIDADKIDREGKIPKEVIKGLGELGILGLTVPEVWGGLGRSQLCYCRVMEELARWCGSTAILVNAHQSIGLKALLLFGTEEQKARWLPKLAKGEELAAFSLTEPNAGSDAAGIETVAVWDEEMGGFWITGNKQWTTNGSISQVWTVMAKFNGKVTAFIVESDSKGIEILNPAQEKVGIRGTRTTNIRFDRVFVPKDQQLGPSGGGLKVCLTALDYGRTTFGATCTGIAKDLLKMAVSYAGRRIQFGKPLIEFEMIQEKIARIAAYTEAMEAATYLTASLIDQGKKDFMLEAAILKVFASESLWEIIYETMQIYGGRSFFTNEPLERMMRDARLNMIGEGANEVLRVFIGAVGLREVGLFMKKSTLWSALKELIGLKRRGSANKEIDRRLKTLRKAVLQLLIRYKEGVVDRQLELNRITEAVMMLFTVIAVDNVGSSSATYYKQLAFRRFDEALKRLNDPQDEQMRQLVEELKHAN